MSDLKPDKVCKHCGCTDIDVDSARGDAVCTNCGSVLVDQIIVSEVQFEENNFGAAHAVGQFVSAEGEKAGWSGFPHTGERESRAQTLQNGRKKIQYLGAQLKLNTHCTDMAYNFYKMALLRNLTRGRRLNHVLAACLYITCRTEGTPHMLLDFSDVLQVNVFILGRTYQYLAQMLCINIPALDPCLYVPRFAHKLEFGEKTHEVTMTALRILSRMKRDWMSTGRRPQGLCGAALLVAARLHEFNRSLSDITSVVNVGTETLTKRLVEFEGTATSELTLDEFHNIDLEEEADPPSFQAAQKKRLDDSNRTPVDGIEKIGKEVTELEKAIDEAITTANEKKFSRYKKYLKPMELDPLEDPIHEMLLGEDIQELINREVVRGGGESNSSGSRGPSPTEEDALEDVHTSKLPANLSHDEIGNSKDLNLENNSESTLTNNTKDSTSPMAPSPGLTTSSTSTDVTTSSKEVSKEVTTDGASQEAVNEAESNELDLTGIDDAEIDRMILTDDEVKIKAALWLKLNASYLRSEKERLLLAKKEETTATNEKKEVKKERRGQKRKEREKSSTVMEALDKVVKSKSLFSSKINYDVLRNLNKQIEGESSSSSTFSAASISSSSSQASTSTDSSTAVEAVGDEEGGEGSSSYVESSLLIDAITTPGSNITNTFLKASSRVAPSKRTTLGMQKSRLIRSRGRKEVDNNILTAAAVTAEVSANPPPPPHASSPKESLLQRMPTEPFNADLDRIGSSGNNIADTLTDQSMSDAKKIRLDNNSHELETFQTIQDVGDTSDNATISNVRTESNDSDGGDVVVESGPIEFDAADEPDGEDEDDYYDDDE